ncbi:MAG: hypothetical protein JXA57_15650 [Armatimonadetes bacterium]|nr:hypothetical protein [Armatimonadota bacterium]
MLTESQRREADDLGLTYTEMTVALSTHVAPEVYARHKAEIRAKREAWERQLADLGDHVERTQTSD